MTGLIDGMSAVVFDFFGTLTPISPSEAWASNASLLAAVFGVPAESLIQLLDDSFPERLAAHSATCGRPCRSWQAGSAYS